MRSRAGSDGAASSYTDPGVSRRTLVSDVESRLPVLKASISELKAAQAALEAQEGRVHQEIERLQQRQERLTKDLSLLPPSSSSPRVKTPLSGSRQRDAEQEEERRGRIQQQKEIRQIEVEMNVAQRHAAHFTKLKAQHTKMYETRIGMWLAVCFIGISVPRFESLYRSRDARNVLEHLFVPVLRFKRKRRMLRTARYLLTQLFLPKMSKPIVEELKNTKLFSKWPPSILQQLKRNLVPITLRRGEFCVMQGNPGALMYIIDHGSVEVLIHNPSADGKRRAPGIRVATLNKRGIYFGEFTVLVEEPRGASVRATETTCLWALHKQALSFWISKLPPPLQVEAREVADERRRANLYKLFPLTARLLKEIPMFQMWSQDHCETLVAKCKPVIFNPGEVIMRQGAPGDFMYFLARGKVHVFSDYQDPSQKLLGSCVPPCVVGEVALLYKEVRSATVVADKIVETWALSTGDFHDLMMSVPEWFLAAKVIVNMQRAARLPPLPMRVVLDCPLVPPGFRTMEWGRKLTGLMQPRVCDVTYPVTQANLEVTEVIFCMQGTFGDEKNVFGKGSVVGIEELLEGVEHWPRTLKARTRVELWTLKIDVFKSYMKSNDKLCAAFYKSIGDEAAKNLGLPCPKV